MPTAFLPPDTMVAIYQGQQPANLTSESLTKRIDLPLDWQEQKIALGF
ncbi:MAG: hypothetical protein JO089_02315 [Alphaproteobacteria bacterium]|nr:hypothetical protein [Alphaproteobacteria bacterium]